jgi:DNA-binding response OmpR family regulator
MVTAAATREAVLRGIQGGADGYVTKPFQIHPLVRAVKEVLGLKYDPGDPDWDFAH